jgi:hypothetical protein
MWGKIEIPSFKTKKIDGSLKNISPKEEEYLNLDSNPSNREKELQKKIDVLEKENEKLKVNLNKILEVEKWDHIEASIKLETLLKLQEKGTIDVLVSHEKFYEVEIVSENGKVFYVTIPLSDYVKMLGTKCAKNRSLNFDTINGRIHLYRNEIPLPV